MVDTTNKALSEPVQGTASWGNTLNSNFTIIDNAFGGNTSISVTSVTTSQTLTSAQYQNLGITFTGTLSADLIYQIPDGVSGRWIIVNNTVGSYTLNISTVTAGNLTVYVLQNYGTAIYSDGVDVYQFGVTDVLSTRSLFGGGFTSAASTAIDYITITTAGNATSFGSLSTARYDLAGVSNGTRGVFGGGTTGAVSAIMDYVTIATTGTAATFGNLTVARSGLAGISSPTIGIFGGGTTGTVSTVMDYIVIATTGNAANWGNLTVDRSGLAGVSNSTRGVFGGGTTGTLSTKIDYIVVSDGGSSYSNGNATTFGTLTVARSGLAGVSNSTRGVFGGGTTGSVSVVMDYITIATNGNAATFGNLTVGRSALAGASNNTRGVFGGGTTGSVSAIMDYITILTTGNATSFGNLTAARYGLAGVSGYVPT